MNDLTSSTPDPFGLIADEFVELYRQGKKPSVEEFACRYPDHAEEIREILPTLVLMEKAKSEVQGLVDRPPITPIPAGGFRQVGDYQILREVGRGGMGVVYEARQLSLGRHVALKVLPSVALLDPRQLSRFRREARAAARLHHTNIVPVFGVGEEDGLHYYVMQFIHGLSLDAVLTELYRLRRPADVPSRPPTDKPGVGADQTRSLSAGRVAHSLLSGEFGPSAPPTVTLDGPRLGGDTGPPPARFGDTSSAVHLPGQSGGSTLTESGRRYWESVARIGMQVADALAYASTQGILHRDIKPSNLLLDDRGNVWVTDFGLAKADSDGDNLTYTGDIIGTLRYMAPERFNGRGDLRSDVYSLGLTLYELLTLRPAFDESDRNKLIMQVMHDEPVRPRKLNGTVPPDLETVVVKAIAREPAHRYQTPAELADDLNRFVEGRPIQARRVSEAERFWRWCSRNPLPASLLAGIMLIFLLGFAGVFWQWRQAVAARKNEEVQRTDALLARDEARTHEANAIAEKQRAEAALYGSNIVRARLQYQANNVADAEDILDRCQVERRGWEWQFLKHLCHAELVTLRGHTSWAYAVAFSPDGKLLASAGGGNPFWPSDGPASIRPAEIILWDAGTGERLSTLRGHTNLIKCLAFSPDGKTLASASQDNTVRLWDRATGKLLCALPGQGKSGVNYVGEGISSVAFSPDGKHLAAGLPHGEIRFWNLSKFPNQVPASSLSFSGAGAHRTVGVAFSPDGQHLAAAYRMEAGGEACKVWDLARYTSELALESSDGVMNGIGWSPDGRYLAGWQYEGFKIWDATTGKLLQNQTTQINIPFAGAFNPTGDLFATGTKDGVVRVWSVPFGQEPRVFRGHRGSIFGVAFSPDGLRLATASADGTVKEWDLTQDLEYGYLEQAREQYDIEAIGFTDGGRKLIAVGRRGKMDVLDCDIRSGWGSLPPIALSGRWQRQAEPACLDGEAHWLAGITQEDPRVAKCWEIATGREQAVLKGHQQPLWFVTINSAGTRIATAGRSDKAQPLGSEIKVWDAVTGQSVFQLDEPDLQVTRLALSPDGKRLAVSALQPIPDTEGRNAEFLPLVRVYDIAKATLKLSFIGTDSVKGEHEGLLGLAFNADGTRLAAAGAERLVLIWDLSMGQPVVLRHGPEHAMDVAFAPDGHRLAVASRYQIKLLDAASGESVLTLLGRKHLAPDTHGFAPRVRFSPDGKQILAICHDNWMPLALWSIDNDSDREPSVRLKEAVHRAIAARLELAQKYARDPTKRSEFAFHLKQLGSLDLTRAEEYVARGDLYRLTGQLNEAAADFARAVALSPENAVILQSIFEGYLAAGLWDEAAPYLDKYFALGRGDPFSFSRIAALPLYRNDRDTYRRYAGLLLERYGKSRDPQTVLDILYWGLLVPDEVATSPQELLRLADWCLVGTESHPNRMWMVMTKGMAEHRAGNYERAVEWLRKAEPAVDHPAAIHLFLCMAYHRLNQPEKAKASYKQALQHLTAYFGSLEGYTPGRGYCYYWPWYQSLRREAESLLNSAKSMEGIKDRDCPTVARVKDSLVTHESDGHSGP